MSKYFNNAIIGNSKILCTLSDKGEILRLYYPNIDYFQLIDSYSLGIINDNKICWLKESELMKQYYDGNILYTELNVNNVSVTLRDYVVPNKNILVRAIKLMKPCKLFIHSKLNSDVNKQVSSTVADNTLIQYCQERYMATFSNHSISKYQINNVKDTLESYQFDMNDYIGMSAEGVIAYNDVTELTLYITLNSTLKECLETVKWCKENPENLFYHSTKEYWDKYIKKFENNELLKATNKVKEKEIITRTLYMYALLSNPETGAVLASPDVDENYTRCGRYGYCWPRDALFINEALKILGMEELLNHFYHDWANKAQLASGLFEQRYYANGELAPSWGLQIDETAAILIGLSRHINYLFQEELIFKATVGLMNFVDENGLSKACYDIWEERKGVHLYSTASIYQALKASYNMLKLIDETKYTYFLERIYHTTQKMKEAIYQYFIEEGHLKRSLDNNQVDISLLSVVTPFHLFEPNDEIIQNTVSEIERTLHMPNGGYMRYQWDNYMGGNTWIISSLWLAMYHIEAGNKEKAQKLFDWVTNHADKLNFLPEQIEREGDKTAWITQLSWSHAMYIIVKSKLM